MDPLSARCCTWGSPWPGLGVKECRQKWTATWRVKAQHARAPTGSIHCLSNWMVHPDGVRKATGPGSERPGSLLCQGCGVTSGKSQSGLITMGNIIFPQRAVVKLKPVWDDVASDNSRALSGQTQEHTWVGAASRVGWAKLPTGNVA